MILTLKIEVYSEVPNRTKGIRYSLFFQMIIFVPSEKPISVLTFLREGVVRDYSGKSTEKRKHTNTRLCQKCQENRTEM